MASATAAKKKLDEKHLKILKDLVAHDTNKHCFDCKQRGPTYVNVTIGSFVCTNCGGALRKYNHRVKSMVMSNFTAQEMEFLMKRGNEACRKIYFGQNDAKVPSDVDISDDRHLDDHLRQKYERKKWYVEPTPSIEEAALSLNQPIYERAEKGGAKSSLSQQNQFARMPNASAGLIMPAPSRPLPKPIANSNMSVTGAATVSISRPSPTLLAATTANNLTTNTQPAFTSKAPASAASFPFTNGSSSFMDPFPMTTSVGVAPSASKVDDPFGPPLSPFMSQPMQSTPFQTSFATATPFASPSNVAVTTASSTSTISTSQMDKYAALKELDGLFGSSLSTTPVSSNSTTNISTSNYYSSAATAAPAAAGTSSFWAQPSPVAPPVMSNLAPASNTNLWSTATHFQGSAPPPYGSVPTISDPFHTGNLNTSTANPFFSMSSSSWGGNAPNSSVPAQPFAPSNNMFSQSSIGGLPANPVNPFNPFMRDNPLPSQGSGNSASASFGNVPAATCTNPFL